VSLKLTGTMKCSFLVCYGDKGTFKILSSTHVVQNLYDFLFSGDHKRTYVCISVKSMRSSDVFRLVLTLYE